MVFKLVRTDCEGPNKIALQVGTHLIGRGKFLDCEDKRISRNHGNLIVSDDSVVIEALHQNPCFWTKKGTTEIQILKKSCKETLHNGDRFGLLPGSFWYEVLHIPESDSEATDVSYTQEQNINKDNLNDEPENDLNNETIQNNQVKPDDGAEKNDDSEFMDFDLNETVDDAGRPESPSLLDQERQQAANNEPTDQSEPNPTTALESDVSDEPAPTDMVKMEPKSPSPKRSHSPDCDEGTKKVKTEPEVKQDMQDVMKQDPDPMAGPSNDQAGASKAADSGSPAPARERCMYAADCYRKNPQHKAQFSHPRDPDWGAARRARLRHPPAARAAPAAGARVVERRGNIFYINAHSVNFYDDHFNVIDSDGDSVDYDYEF